MQIILKVFCSFIFFVLPYQLSAYNLRQINSRSGLSNSSVNSLFQDSERFLWIGTYDGVNMYDGKNIYVHKPNIHDENSLSSNVTRNIIETEDDFIWVSTKGGLHKLSRKSKKVEEFYGNVKDDSYLGKDSNDNLFLLYKKGVISWYDKRNKTFLDLPINKETICENVNHLVIDDNDTIWILHKGVLERYTVNYADNGDPSITRHADYKHPNFIEYLFYSNKSLIIVDREGNIHTVTPEGKIFIRNISYLIRENGTVSTAIFDNQDVLIGFKSNGLYRLNSLDDYQISQLNINCGVFCLLKDEKQDIIWVGTDGQGLYALTHDEYSFRNLSLVELPIHKERPVRAIQTDHQGNLWLGTKENGVIRINDYATNNDYSSKNVTHFTTTEGLSNNAIFALERSNVHNILWIGSDGDHLNYYSFDDNRIHTLSNKGDHPPSFVHAMFEVNDTLLWVGAGNSLLKVTIRKQGNQLEAIRTKKYIFDVKNKQPFNQIYALCPENDSIIWVGIRGNGVVRFNSITEKHRLITFDKEGIPPMNDVLCLHIDKNKALWVGSSYGITQLIYSKEGTYTYNNYDEEDGLPNNTIHGILEEEGGKLWLSSNTGVILFDTEKETFRSFGQRTGLRTVEFSDNAYFKDEITQTFFFGGVDGAVWIQKEKYEKNKFVPDVHFMKLRIFNRDYNIYDFEKKKKGSRYIELSHRQNFFAVSFVATDFVNGDNCRYSYKLDNFSNVWMDTRQNEAQFTNIPPGSYTLYVKYNDGMDESESRIQSLHIVILPPWYLTVYAKIFYGILIAGLLFLVYYYIRWKYEKRRRKVDHQLKEKYKEEMYESKLRFFTNITHEFSTPLTLIYGPCERILTHQNSDSFVMKYARIIKANTIRLNTLIQEIIDFRKVETGNQIRHIQRLDISLITNEIVESFIELAEQNNIRFETDIQPDIIWNSDHSCYTKILVNLISNAFKYTTEYGHVFVSAKEEDNQLVLKVYNSGKGIRQENIPLIFNRYSVLDNVSENSIKGLSSRNGLGLAICHSMVVLLEGTIDVKSKVNEYVEFIVMLPILETSNSETEVNHQTELNSERSATNDIISTVENPDIPLHYGDIPKPYILIVDDNKELLWMLTDILSDEYKIKSAEDGEQGLEILRNGIPDLIITDIMMPNMSGITLIRQIKENRHTMHIPLAILSAKNANDEKIEGLESGADAYITKPFDSEYLKAVLRRLINSKKTLEQYYNSSASAFEFVNGQLLEKEEKDFLQTAVEIIDRNIDNTEFTPDELANDMQTSVRNLYRKFKDMSQLSPNDFIKERRISHAARLLLTTTFTIQEIMYLSGFSSRSHFYKEFGKRHKQTPKEYRETYKLKDSSF